MLLVLAVLFLALVILFREEIRFMIGALIILGAATWLWNQLSTSWPVWLAGGGLVAAAAVYGIQREHLRRQARAPKPGQTPLDVELAILKDRLEHGELTDDQYQQAVIAVMARYNVRPASENST